MADECAYRSSDPEVLASWKEWTDRYRQWQRDCLAFARQLGPERQPVGGTSWGDVDLMGVEWSESELVPDGWRLVRSKWPFPPRVVPLRKSKAGRELSDRMHALRLGAWDCPGMPDCVWEGGSIHRPGVEEGAGYLYLFWSVAPEKVESAGAGMRRPGGFDPGLWEPVKLSEFYAMRERRESREKETVQ